MTVQQKRLKIAEIIEQFPEETLEIILDYLTEIQKKTILNNNTKANLIQILKEDQNLLKRLAQ